MYTHSDLVYAWQCPLSIDVAMFDCKHGAAVTNISYTGHGDKITVSHCVSTCRLLCIFVQIEVFSTYLKC